MIVLRDRVVGSRPQGELDPMEARAEALLGGLRTPVVMAEDAATVQRRARDFYETLKPQNDFHCWLVSEVALLSVRIDRCERIERRLRDKIAIRAELFWDDDRRLEAILLGEQLASRPEVVVDQLGKTVHGCEWMMGRWALLAHAADIKGSWTVPQTQLAFDLLATPSEFREGLLPGAALDLEGRVLAENHDPAGVARRQIAELKRRRDRLAGVDLANRALARADLNDDADPELRRLRRLEAGLHRRLRWCLDQLQVESPHSAPLRGLMASWLGQEEPAPASQTPALPVAETAVPPTKNPEHPPMDLAPDEVPAMGQAVDLPAILANRREERLQRAEARREARRRKVEKLRA